MPLPQPNARPDRLALVLYAEGCREPLFCCPQTHSVIWTKIKTSQLGPPPEKLASSEIIIIQTQAQNFHRSGSASHMLYGGGQHRGYFMHPFCVSPFQTIAVVYSHSVFHLP